MAHVATITIDHTKVPGDLTDYVGLIVPDGSAGYSALYALCLEGGGDIRLFKSDDTTELAREIVSFSVSSETGEIHYKYSGTLSSSVDTPIHVYADGSSSDYAVGATYGRNAVWTDYGGVWHMNGSGTTLTDSTGNGNTGTKDTSTRPEEINGQIGKAQQGTNASQEIEAGSDASIDDLWSGGGTLSCWTKQTNYPGINGGSSGWPFGKNDISGWVIFSSSGRNMEMYHAFSSSAARFNIGNDFGLGTRKKLTIKYNKDSSSNRPTYYVNATKPTVVVQAAPSGSPASDASGSLYMMNRVSGGQAYDGDLDEVRFRKSYMVSDNWEEAEYNNQNSYSTFYSVAAVSGGSPAQAARRGVIMMM